MSAIASIGINDAQSTPVSHAFVHHSHSKDGAVYKDSTSGLTQLSAPSIEFTRLPSRAKNLRRVRVKAIVPILETVTGGTSDGYVAAPRKVGSVEAVCDFVIHDRATEQTIKDARAFLAGAMGSSNTQFFDLLISDLAPY